MVRYEIDVYADTICPWCFIGKKTLDLAIEKHRSRHPDDEFHLTWRPFMLFPNARVSAYDKKASFILKFGPGALTVLDRMERVGASYGLHFNWEGRTGSSRDSHKLILLAAEQDAAAAAAATISSFSSASSSSSATATTTTTDTTPSSIAEPERHREHEPPHGPSCPPVPGSGYSASLKQAIDTGTDTNTNADRCTDAMDIDSPPSSTTTTTTTKAASLTHSLFHGALTLGADISSRATFLIPLGLSHGLASSAEELTAQLDSAALDARIDAEMVRARRDVGITAVPSYVVNGRYRVGGMQEPGVFEGLFERIRRAG